ncbi:MAG TPA: PIG-L deacetylase family protein [Mycobacteriales bacterium]|nr:PIG-L deacetylase family protein [Mycobacteriales bacterium]
MTVERALAVMAHPDDVDFGAAGTIAQWTDAGIGVTYCIITDGDAGGFDPAIPRNEIGTIRRAEQTAAAKQVGVDDVRFLGYPDGRLEVSFDVRRDIARVIREVRPQRVVCQSPVRNMNRIPTSHPDHLAAGEATMCAVYPDARNPFAFPDLAELEAWSVAETWVQGMERSNRYVDVTDTWDRKMAALHSHVSQHPEPGRLDPMMRGWNGNNAIAAGLPAGRLAEAFWVMTTA